MMEVNENSSDLENSIMKFMGRSEMMTKIQDMVNRSQRRLIINIDTVRQYDAHLASQIIANPMKIIPMFEAHLQEQTNEVLHSSDKLKSQKNDKSLLSMKQVPFKVTFEGTFGRNMVSPRGLGAELTNQFVCVQGIVTRMSIVRPKLVHSVHYSESTKQGSVKEYHDNFSMNNNLVNGNFQGEKGTSYLSNTVPTKDIHGNPLDFEYGLSFFRDFQTLLVQEPPERTPVGQLPRSVEVVLEDDLVDKVKPGDRQAFILINFLIFSFIEFKYQEFINASHHNLLPFLELSELF
jgi:DNA replication licensing factor MCM3